MEGATLSAAKLRTEDTLEHLTVAMWSDEGTFNHGYHLNQATECLAGLAYLLGYRIEKIETEERTCQITGFKYEGGIAKPFTDEQLGWK
jgi:hypothetical protein